MFNNVGGMIDFGTKSAKDNPDGMHRWFEKVVVPLENQVNLA